MDGQFYLSAFKDFKDMGCDGAAVEVLREGLVALPSCQELVELARREGVSLQEAPAPASPFPAARPAAAAPPVAAAAPAPVAPVADWRPPPPPRPNLERVRANPAVRKIIEAQDAVAAFAEADAAAWAALRERAGGRAEALLAEEGRLRSLAIRAFDEGKDDLRRLSVEARPELLRTPCTPDLPSAVQSAWTRGGPAAALREVAARAAPGAFQDGLWDSEGPGAQLDLARRLSACEAPISRARDVARTGPGTVHSLLAAIAEEAGAAVRALPAGTARVLVVGGHGASAVTAARAGAKRVVVWERQGFVAGAAREVLQRNLELEEARRCSVEEAEQAPAGPWDVVVVDLWHGVGALAWGPLEAIRSARVAAGGALGRVIPAKISVEVALADGRLTCASGFDLSRLDARFRGLSAAPLRVELDSAEAHPTSLRPAMMTEAVIAFDLDLQGELAAEAGPVALPLRATCSGVASMAVVSLSFGLGREPGLETDKARVLRFGQWLSGGYSVTEGKVVHGLSARRGPGRIWVDWDWGGAAEPPLGYMALSDWYYEMLRDEARHEAYDRALRAEVQAVRARSAGSCRVLDVGSGDGILSMMALRAGASAAAGVEVVTAIARLSEEIVAANRPSAGRPDAPLPPADQAPLDIWCTDVRGVSKPPEALKFDVLVSELMDASGLGENLILLTRGARERLCRQGAPVIPCRLRLLAVLCEVRLPTLAGVNLDAFWPFWPSERMDEGLWIGVDLDKHDGDFRILTQPTEFLSLELGVADVHDVPPRKEIDFPGTADGTANCIVWWFDAQLSREDPSAVLANAPNCVDSRHAATCWGQAMAELPSAMEVRQGATSEVTMEVPFGDYQLTFRPRSSAPAAGSRAAQRQKPSSEPPPRAQPYSARYSEELEAYKKLRAEMDTFRRSRKIGQTAMRTADVGALNVLQRTALCLSSQPFLFGVEPSIAAKMLAGWYSVGGEGRT